MLPGFYIIDEAIAGHEIQKNLKNCNSVIFDTKAKDIEEEFEPVEIKNKIYTAAKLVINYGFGINETMDEFSLPSEHKNQILEKPKK